MKILIIQKKIPFPPHTGGSVRIFNLIKRISEHFEITLLCISDKKLIKNAEHLLPYCKNIYLVPIRTDRSHIEKALTLLNPLEWPRFFIRLLLLLQGVPLGVVNMYNPQVSNKLRQALSAEEYDLIQFEFIEMGIYLNDIIGFKKNAKLVLVEHDIMCIQKKRKLNFISWPLKMFYAVDLFLRQKWEIRLLSRFEHVIAMSDIDKKQLISFGIAKNKISVIKSGADINNFRYNEFRSAKKFMVSLGTMKFLPNRDGFIWFMENVYPIIVKKIPDMELRIIGEKDAEICKRYTSPNIIFHGVVKNLNEHMGNGGVFVAPIRIGSGTRLKIVTAMAFGMPVVSTSIGMEGIEANEANGVIIADTKDKFAEAVIDLFKNKQIRIHLGQEARKFVEREYSWESISKDLVELYSMLLE